MKLEITEDTSGSRYFPICVHDMDHPFGETIARFRDRSDAELFVRAKEGEAYLAANPWPAMEDVGTPEYREAIRKRIDGPNASSLCSQCGERPRCQNYIYCESCLGKYQGSQPPAEDVKPLPIRELLEADQKVFEKLRDAEVKADLLICSECGCVMENGGQPFCLCGKIK